MNNNDILRRLRFAFDFSDQQAIELFTLDPRSSTHIDKASFIAKLTKEDDADFSTCHDTELCAFLDGLIVLKRGLKDPIPKTATSEPPTSEPTAKPADFRMSKNDILKKLRIAMSFREQEMLDTLEQGGSKLSKSELGALFRNPDHKHYRVCGGQVLRNFIKGLTKSLRGD